MNVSLHGKISDNVKKIWDKSKMTLSGFEYIHNSCNKKVLSILLLKIYGLNPTEYIDLSSTIPSYKLGKFTPVAPKETACCEQYAEHIWFRSTAFAICSCTICSSYHCIWKKGDWKRKANEQKRNILKWKSYCYSQIS